MRTFTTISLFVLLVLTTSVTSVQAQMEFLGTVDSSFRTEILIGTQSFRYTQQFTSDAEHSFSHTTAFDPRVPLLAGVVEVSPLPFASGRIAGAIAVLQTNGSLFRTAEVTSSTIDTRGWDLRPDVGSWEAAGLYHLWNDGGYRFSLTGGYRQEVWLYHGSGVGFRNPGARLRDELASQIPFLGLQTSMFFPWWKARFEVLGSAFMTKKVTSLLQNGVSFIEHQAKLTTGGLLEFQMEGTVSLTQYLRTGLHARYTYQEMHGHSTRTSNSEAPASLDLSTMDNYFTVGLDLGVVF